MRDVGCDEAGKGDLRERLYGREMEDGASSCAVLD